MKIVEMRGSGFRTSSGRPQFVLIGLVLLLFVVCFKYWNLATIDADLQENLRAAEKRLVKSGNDRQILLQEKSALKIELDSVRSNLKEKDDENTELTRRIKAMSDEIDAGKNSLDDKAKEISKCQEEVSALKSKLDEKVADIERLQANVELQIGQLKKEEVLPSKLLSVSPEIPLPEDADKARQAWSQKGGLRPRVSPGFGFVGFNGMLMYGSPLIVDPPDAVLLKPRFSVVNVPNSVAHLRALEREP